MSDELRLSQVEMRFIDHEEVSRRLTYEMCIPIVRQAMITFSRGDTKQLALDNNALLLTARRTPSFTMAAEVPQHAVSNVAARVSKDKRQSLAPGVRMALPSASELLSHGPEDDFVHVHILWLADGKGNGRCEGLRRNRGLIALANDIGDIPFCDAVRQLSSHRSR
jgi:hypothetical protein